MRNPTLLVLAAAMGLSTATAADAAEKYPWRQHQAPFDFVFGNGIDTHQQTRRQADGSLNGYLYIRYTGVVTQDGYPVGKHVDCGAVTDCIVGWTLEAKPSRATLVGQPMHDHPVYLLERPDIPQPGAYSHFHWLGMGMPMPYIEADGYLLQLSAANRFCFIHHGADAATSTATCRDNGGIRVERGLDVSTHLNIVTNDPAGL